MTAQTILPANTLSGGYDVANSARFHENAYMSQTWGSSGNRRTWTLSMWFKYSGLNNCRIFSIGDNTSNTMLDFFFTSGDLRVQDTQSGSETLEFRTDQVFRDPISWSHLVFACDTTQGTEANRFKIYHNGTQITSFSTETYPDENLETLMNHTTGAATVGARAVSQSGTEFDGYMAEVVVLDGTAAAPTSFGEFDSDSGIWKPIDVSGLTFGTNGFYLDFEDSSNLGNDANGGSDFSETNFAATDQSIDTCTNNFPTLNPLFLSAATLNFTEGNLTNNGVSSTAYRSAYGTIGVSTGKWYFEFRVDKVADSDMAVGIVHEDQIVQTASNGRFYTGTKGYGYGAADGDKLNNDANNGAGANYGSAFTSVGNIVGCALDLDNGKIYFSLNGTFQASGDPTTGATGTGSAFDVTLGGFYFPAITTENDDDRYSINFGSPPYSESGGNSDGEGFGNFAGSVPSGYFAICTKNLAEYGG